MKSKKYNYQRHFAQSPRPVSISRGFHTRIVSTEKLIKPVDTVVLSDVSIRHLKNVEILKAPELFKVSVDRNIHEEKRG